MYKPNTRYTVILHRVYGWYAAFYMWFYHREEGDTTQSLRVVCSLSANKQHTSPGAAAPDLLGICSRLKNVLF